MGTNSNDQQPYAALLAWQQSVTQDLRNFGRAIRRLAKSNQAQTILATAHAEHLEELNGKLAALQTIKDLAPQLQIIAEKLDPKKLDTIIALSEAKAEDEAFRRGLKKRLNPFRPLGLLIWTVVLAMISAIAYELVKFKISGHF